MSNLFKWIFLLQIVIIASEDMDTVQCKYPCSCNFKTKSATCNARHLRYIPRLPSDIKTVKFVQNNFTYLDKYFFRNLTSNNRIVTLNLTDNLIHYISTNAFLEFKYLMTLDISKEPNLNITMLQQSLYSLPVRQMSFIQFSGNGWRTLPTNFFLPFINSYRTSFSISLTRNKLQSIDSKLFLFLLNLKTLNLAWNSIKNVTLENAISVRVLNLNSNFVRDIPVWCGPRNKTMVPNLQKLYLSDNSIAEMDSFSFRCLGNLKILNLDANNFRTLQSNTFSELQSLNTLYISENTRLKTIEDYAFNVSSLQFLYFTRNHYQFNKGIHYNYNPKNLFMQCPDLEQLDMSYNNLPTRNQYNYFRDIFRPLVKLKILRLESTSMRSLPYYAFPTMKYLQILDLQKNLLQGWNRSDQVFGTNSSLKILNLRSNLIRVVNKTTFPSSLLFSLDKLDLGENYFSCSCDQMWFRDWIRTNFESKISYSKLMLVGYPEYYKCKLPGDMRGVPLQDYNPTDDNCQQANPLIITISLLTGAGILSFLVIFIMYRCQTNIRNYLYLCRFYKNKKSGYIQLDNCEDYEYHAFIVYCDADRNWVHNVCVKKLENEEGMKICIHHRDFDIGEPVTGNIEKYMGKCRKVIVVMSNNFAESEWCQWEVDLVHERRRRQGKGVSLLIMLRSIDSKHMTNRLRALLDSTPHLTYCSGVGEKLFWTAFIKGLRKPIGHPPFAVV
ncbi:toll-like receptor 13 [Mytilus galloprovincialis]|uniref:Toll-like receptor 13 n=1 Tax=Mytilus galloprovincialis TaxID=29158 RepID=A0A8B6GE85_MYTGA|nr:toll-like receptor 13 [Mytilus galloprovincialis]